MAVKYISYLRVSTLKQGESGLGLEAQRAAINAFLKDRDGELLGEYRETESGKDNERPDLGKALQQCKLTDATLLIAKLDRLSRDAHFLLGLKKAEVKFVAADMPNANDLTVGIMAVVAEEERKMISARTKSALQAAKARGVKLGGWREGPIVRHEDGTRAILKAADNFAAQVGPTIRELQTQGNSLNKIAAELTAKGIRTARGGAWTAKAVSNVLSRLQRCAPPE